MAQRKVNVALKSVGPRVTKTGWDALDATDLPDTAVTPGSYTNADITVDAQGRVTAAANGTIPPGYTDEQAQDAVGAMAANSARVTLTYVDGTPSLTADLVIDSIPHTYLHATGSPMLLGRSAGGAGQVNEEYCSPLAFSLIAQTSTTAMQSTLGLGSACTLAADTDGTLAANSDVRVATQKAVKTYVDNAVVGLLDFKGSTDCSANPNYPAALKGDAYMVSVAGKIGGASGLVVTPGDLFFAIADNVGGTQAAVGASWNVLEYNVTGALMAANNLSDLTNVATARSNLGLVIGTNVQAYDATLAALAGYNTNGFLVQIAPDTFLARNITGTTNEITVTNGGGLAGDTVISLPADVLIPAVLTCKNTGMHIIDAGNAFDLIVKPGSTYTADRTLTITTGDANRTLTLAGDATVTGTNTGDQTITLTGDVTGSGTGSFAATIAANAVTYAKMQDVSATNRVLGRKTAGAGDAEELTLSDVLNMAGATATGDVLVHSGAGWVRLPVGAVGQTLAVGVSSVPMWIDSPNPNLLANGSFRVNQRGLSSYTTSTSPANSDDTYLLDQWVLLAEANNAVTVAQSTSSPPTGSYCAATLTVVSGVTNKKFGLVTFLEARDAAAVVGGNVSLQFKAKVTGTSIANVRVAVLSWSGTADVLTSDVVSSWAVTGTVPTWATNWTAEEIPTDLALTTSWQTFKIENVPIDTAGAKNLAVFIWNDDTTTTVGDVLHLAAVKLEAGPVCTPYAEPPVADELARCQRYFFQLSGTGGRYYNGRVAATNQADFAWPLPVTMRAAPTTTLSGSGMHVHDGSVDVTATAVSVSLSDAAVMMASLTASASTLTVHRVTMVYFADTTTALRASCEL